MRSSRARSSPVAIRPLPELCLGIVSERLETQGPSRLLLWLDNSKPRHARGFLSPSVCIGSHRTRRQVRRASPGPSHLTLGGLGRLRDPRLARLVPWDSIGASGGLAHFLQITAFTHLEPGLRDRGFLSLSVSVREGRLFHRTERKLAALVSWSSAPYPPTGQMTSPGPSRVRDGSGRLRDPRLA
jgi:hypothetical protein